MRAVNEIIVHCSATPDGRPVTVQQIRQWHLQRKFADIGYHFVIYLDGSELTFKVPLADLLDGDRPALGSGTAVDDDLVDLSHG